METALAVPTVRLAGTEVAALTLEQAVTTVLGLLPRRGPDQPPGEAHLVVTPNVDHLVLLGDDDEFAAAYAGADLRVADGAPLLALARVLGSPLPGRVTGVDLASALLAAAAPRGHSVYFLGGDPEVLAAAQAAVRQRFPGLSVAGASAARIDLDRVTPDEAAALDEIRATRPDLLFLFLGAPKQEKWFARRRAQLPPLVALGLGGTVDLLAGRRRRAPAVVQSVGAEWLWRLAQDPRRLAARYLVRDPRFLRCAWRDVRAQRRGRCAAR